jgi:replication factor C subunit 3/5
MKIVRILTIV